MIGAIFPVGGSFKGPISYLETGKDGLQHGRVAWMEFHNLPTRNAQLAACFMAATARNSVSGTRTPVYHFSVSFDVDDPVDEAMMRRVAERTLRDMGLREYEAVVAAHQDRSHLHLHFVVNRVHPERFTLWSNWWDYARLEKSLRAQEVELGLRIVPGWHSPVPAAAPARDGLAGPQPEGARVRPQPGPKRGGAGFLREVTERAAPVLEQARSWAELERGLAERGLSLRVKGGGFTVTDGSRQVKASEVGRAFSRFHLEKRLGQYPDYRARMAVAESALAPASSTFRAERSVGRQESATPPPAAPATQVPAPTPQPVVRAVRRPQFGDAGHGINELFGYTGEGVRSGAVVERVLAPQPGLAEPAVPPLTTSSDDFLLVDAAAAPSPAAPEPVAEPAPQPPVHSSPVEAREPTQPDPWPVEPPAEPRRRLVDFLKEVKERGGPVLERADSWEALERGLANHGLSLRVKGGGFLVTDGQMEVKASEVGRAFSRFHLENRLGRYPHYRAPAASTEPAPKPTVPESVGQQERPAPAPLQSPPPVVKPVAPVQPVVLPAPAVPPAETVQPIRPVSAQQVESSKPAQPRRRPVDFLSEVKERATRVLARADSWAELERGLADLGLSLRAKGGGFTVTDGELEVKASDVGRAFSRFHLERRLGRYPASVAGGAAPRITPAPPKPAIRDEIPSQGPEQSVPAPGQIQPLPAGKAPEADAAFVSLQDRYRQWIDVALDKAAECLHVLEEWDAADVVLKDARAVLYAAGTASFALDRWKSPAVVVMAHLRQSATSVYLDPESAVRELLDYARDDKTLEEAKEWLRTRPQYFGKLTPDGPARRNARGIPDRLDAAARHEWKRPKPEDYTRAAEEVKKAKAAVDAASAARDAVSELSRDSLMERVMLALQPLRAAIGHEEIERRLGQKLTPGAASLLPQALRAAVKLAEGPQQGHGYEIG